MKNLDKRLTRLEKAAMPDSKRFAVVTYDVQVGPPAGRPAPGVVYLPHNGRDRVWGIESFVHGNAETAWQSHTRARELR